MSTVIVDAMAEKFYDMQRQREELCAEIERLGSAYSKDNERFRSLRTALVNAIWLLEHNQTDSALNALRRALREA